MSTKRQPTKREWHKEGISRRAVGLDIMYALRKRRIYPVDVGRKGERRWYDFSTDMCMHHASDIIHATSPKGSVISTEFVEWPPAWRVTVRPGEG